MGAHNFLDLATAKTATLAYESACSEATYESGHDPYNGTISTTSGFQELPERFFKGLGRKARLLILEAVALGDGLEKKQLGGKAWASYNLLKGTAPASKWGRCYAVRLDSKTYAFAGWAAS